MTDIIKEYKKGRRDFKGVDFKGVDFKGVDLTGVNFKGADYEDVYFDVDLFIL